MGATQPAHGQRAASGARFDPILLALMYAVPILASIGPLFFTDSRPVRMALLAAAPMTLALCLGAVCAASSRRVRS